MGADATKPATRPEVPAQTNQFIATLAAEVGLVHGAVLRVQFGILLKRRVMNRIERRDYRPGVSNSNTLLLQCKLKFLCAPAVFFVSVC